VLTHLGQPHAAASSLRDGLAHLDRERSGDLAASAGETLEQLRSAAGLDQKEEVPS
jgi:hypothetical protein